MESAKVAGLTLYFDAEERDAAAVIRDACADSVQVIRECWGLAPPPGCAVFVMTSWLDLVFRSAPWHRRRGILERHRPPAGDLLLWFWRSVVTEISDVARRAGELFDSGLNCTESLVVAFAEESGFDCSAFPRVATGFCAGVSRTCGTCGAVSGGIMAIGLRIGRASAEESNEGCYAAVQRFKQAFNERFGSENCRDLTGCDFSTQEGRDAFEERNLQPQCRHYVEVAAELAMAAIVP